MPSRKPPRASSSGMITIQVRRNAIVGPYSRLWKLRGRAGSWTRHRGTDTKCRDHFSRDEPAIAAEGRLSSVLLDMATCALASLSVALGLRDKDSTGGTILANRRLKTRHPTRLTPRLRWPRMAGLKGLWRGRRARDIGACPPGMMPLSGWPRFPRAPLSFDSSGQGSMMLEMKRLRRHSPSRGSWWHN
jgi:hypothetical protein